MLYLIFPEEVLLDLGGPWFWMFAGIILFGGVIENMRNIALSTTVTLLIPVERHANANGLVGTVTGLAFIVTSVFSGLSIGILGMGWTLLIAIVVTALVLGHLLIAAALAFLTRSYRKISATYQETTADETDDDPASAPAAEPTPVSTS